MIIVNYKSKRQLKKAIGKPLNYFSYSGAVKNGEPFFVMNCGDTFRATVILANDVIVSVR